MSEITYYQRNRYITTLNRLKKINIDYYQKMT